MGGLEAFPGFCVASEARIANAQMYVIKLVMEGFHLAFSVSGSWYSI